MEKGGQEAIFTIFEERESWKKRRQNAIMIE